MDNKQISIILIFSTIIVILGVIYYSSSKTTTTTDSQLSKSQNILRSNQTSSVDFVIKNANDDLETVKLETVLPSVLPSVLPNALGNALPSVSQILPRLNPDVFMAVSNSFTDKDIIGGNFQPLILPNARFIDSKYFQYDSASGKLKCLFRGFIQVNAAVSLHSMNYGNAPASNFLISIFSGNYEACRGTQLFDMRAAELTLNVSTLMAVDKDYLISIGFLSGVNAKLRMSAVQTYFNAFIVKTYE